MALTRTLFFLVLVLSAFVHTSVARFANSPTSGGGVRGAQETTTAETTTTTGSIATISTGGSTTGNNQTGNCTGSNCTTSSPGLGVGWIVLIVIGGSVVVGGAASGIFWYIRHQRHKYTPIPNI